MELLDKAQIEALDKLHNGNILCGGVGSGKSRTALAYYLTKVCDGKLFPKLAPPTNCVSLYIITTAKKRDSKEWEEEMALFGVTGVVDSWNNIHKYQYVENSFFIFDEQRLVGSGAWVNSFYRITSSGRYNKQEHNNSWILLTATPGDNWEDYIPVFVANKFYKNKTEFQYTHIVYNKFTKFPCVDKFLMEDTLKIHRDHILVDINFTRHTIRHYETVPTQYSKDKVRAVMKDRFNPYTNEPIIDAAQLCYVLRRIVNEDPSRLDALHLLLLEHPKAIIFYNFDYELEILRKFMEDINMPYAEWNGHKHQPIPSSSNAWTYLVQYTAGAEGWNCIETDTIIFYSLNYSYKATEQASGRIDRRNTPFKDLHYYFLKSNAWIDNAVKKSLDRKKKFNERSHAKSLGF